MEEVLSSSSTLGQKMGDLKSSRTGSDAAAAAAGLSKSIIRPGWLGGRETCCLLCWLFPQSSSQGSKNCVPLLVRNAAQNGLKNIVFSSVSHYHRPCFRMTYK